MITLEYWIGDKWVSAGEFHSEHLAWISLGDDNANYRTVDENGTVLTDKSVNSLGIDPDVEKKAELLQKLRAERPEQIIHEVIAFCIDSEHGFLNVKVDMQGHFMETTIRHVHTTLPYPLADFEKLTSVQQLDWRWTYVY